ncbi:MAG: FtsX-like permease family protein, partial [Acidobacteriota bacterium]|nr:FtsX-like permease family protein [Acidobacteriota bacterium]
ALAAGSSSSNSIDVPGIPKVNGRSPSSNITLVGANYFRTLEIPVLAGRPVDERDEFSPQCAAVVNELFAKKFFPGQSAVGRHFSLHNGKSPVDIEIVGVAKNSLYSSLKKETPAVAYISWPQTLPLWSAGGIDFEVRTVGDPFALANSVRQIVHDAAPRMPVGQFSTQARQIDATISPERTFASLCTCFGILALAIACVGLYGSMAYSVSRRTSEIGIRVALGAQRRRVIWMVLRDVLLLSGAGLVIGSAAAWESSRLVASFLFGLKPNDPLVFAGAVLVLALAALAAGYAPAWRASRIDPMEALRHE